MLTHDQLLELNRRMIDLWDPQQPMEIIVKPSVGGQGKSDVWVNVGSVCVLRAKWADVSVEVKK